MKLDINLRTGRAADLDFLRLKPANAVSARDHTPREPRIEAQPGVARSTAFRLKTSGAKTSGNRELDASRPKASWQLSLQRRLGAPYLARFLRDVGIPLRSNTSSRPGNNGSTLQIFVVSHISRNERDMGTSTKGTVDADKAVGNRALINHPNRRSRTEALLVVASNPTRWRSSTEQRSEYSPACPSGKTHMR